jgi:hypothetical protein
MNEKTLNKLLSGHEFAEKCSEEFHKWMVCSENIKFSEEMYHHYRLDFLIHKARLRLTDRRLKELCQKYPEYNFKVHINKKDNDEILFPTKFDINICAQSLYVSWEFWITIVPYHKNSGKEVWLHVDAYEELEPDDIRAQTLHYDGDGSLMYCKECKHLSVSRFNSRDDVSKSIQKKMIDFIVRKYEKLLDKTQIRYEESLKKEQEDEE